MNHTDPFFNGPIFYLPADNSSQTMRGSGQNYNSYLYRNELNNATQSFNQACLYSGAHPDDCDEASRRSGYNRSYCLGS